MYECNDHQVSVDLQKSTIKTCGVEGLVIMAHFRYPGFGLGGGGKEATVTLMEEKKSSSKVNNNKKKGDSKVGKSWRRCERR